MANSTARNVLAFLAGYVLPAWADYGGRKLQKTARALFALAMTMLLLGLDSFLFRPHTDWRLFSAGGMLWFFLARRADGLTRKRKALTLIIISLSAATGLLLAETGLLMPAAKVPLLVLSCLLAFAVLRSRGKLWASAGLSVVAMSLVGVSLLQGEPLLLCLQAFAYALAGAILTELILPEPSLAPIAEAETKAFLEIAAAALKHLRLCLESGAMPESETLAPLDKARYRLISSLESGSPEKLESNLMRVAISQCRLERSLAMCLSAVEDMLKRGPFGPEALACPKEALAAGETLLLAASSGSASSPFTQEAASFDSSMKSLLDAQAAQLKTDSRLPFVLTLSLLYPLARLSPNLLKISEALEGLRK